MFGNSGALRDVKYAIHRHGTIIAGFNITSEWFSPAKGVVYHKAGCSAEGGHAVHLVGYDEDGVLIQNSWGPGYAHGGFVYLTNYAFEQEFMYAALLTNTLNNLN